ncbi:unnamed protein product [Pseudo-nitzschia multistriata]|uniref:Uncharacterized protein n=1 Tax=Pseudo-nitzschia multistriata TaxID=183589 RepID=A0A448YW45_9STRA|nr:unnamed protein product [Pseudo-nitzschia multistriata]
MTKLERPMLSSFCIRYKGVLENSSTLTNKASDLRASTVSASRQHKFFLRASPLALKGLHLQMILIGLSSFSTSLMDPPPAFGLWLKISSGGRRESEEEDEVERDKSTLVVSSMLDI